MNPSPESRNTDHRPLMGEGTSILLGSLAGFAGGIPLGGLIAAIVAPAWSLTAAIIVAHVTLAMVAMGAWTAPSLLSDPERDAEISAGTATSSPRHAE